ncbi:hypothetical protein BROUX41_000293 [Berkeleyomyces rouxiae]|uniref:uncharacterized protein n=1 Tax=Berkeleyomyces rouxiae TaxID=2035830 RepID=UPI003B819526
MTWSKRAATGPHDGYSYGPGYEHGLGHVPLDDNTDTRSAAQGRVSASITSLADFDPFAMSMAADMDDDDEVSGYPAPAAGATTTTAPTIETIIPTAPIQSEQSVSPAPFSPHWHTPAPRESHSLRAMPSEISILTPSERTFDPRASQISLGTLYDAPYDSLVAPNVPHSTDSLWSGSGWGNTSKDYDPIQNISSDNDIGEDDGSVMGTPFQPSHQPRLPPRRSQSKLSKLSRGLSLRYKHQTIPEEDDYGDMVPMLEQASVPDGVSVGPRDLRQDTYTTTTGLQEPQYSPGTVATEPGRVSVPIAALNAKLLHELQQQELNGTLTGGIGAGHQPPATRLHSSALGIVSAGSVTQEGGATQNYRGGPLEDFEAAHQGTTYYRSRGGLLRSFTSRNTGIGRTLSRASTIDDLSQAEANRLGQPIEVVFDEPFFPTKAYDTKFDVDISAMTGPGSSTLDDPTMPPVAKRMTASFLTPLTKRIATSTSTPMVYFPQPNWKPFTMRRVYMSFLVALSLVLTIGIEVMFQLNHNAEVARFKNPAQLPPWKYFLIKFLPIIVSVVYGVLWQLVDYDVKRLEAFYQLSRNGGALASRSLNVDYITDTHIFVPIQAAKFGHYAVAISSVAAMLSISVVPTLAAATLYLYPNRAARLAQPDGLKSIRINATYTHLLSGTLVLCAVCAVALLVVLERRRSGLTSNPRGLAGLAAMAVVSHILMDFKDMDLASHADLHRRLKYQRYVLQNNALAPNADNPPLGSGPAKKDGSGAHDTYDDDDDDNDDDNDNEEDGMANSEAQTKGATNGITENPHPLILRSAGCIPFIITIVLFIGFIPALLFSGMNVIMDQVPWLITLLAVLIKLGWGWLDKVVRLIEPYYILSKRQASPLTLTLDYTAMPFGYMPYRALRNGHWLMFTVGFGSVIVEMLTVVLTSLSHVEGQDLITGHRSKSENATSSNSSGGGRRLGLVLARTAQQALLARRDDDDDDESASSSFDKSLNSGQETRMSFFVSLGCALFILVYLAVVAMVVFTRRRHPFVPRQPNTIASALSYMHQSKMLYDFVGTSRLTTAQMEKRLLELGKTYGLGTFKGRDGQLHVGVDQELLTGSYKHGQVMGQSDEPWNTMWDRY